MEWDEQDLWFNRVQREDPHLGEQLMRVFNAMRDGRARTLGEIASMTGDPPASISARLRDLRKTRFGAHTVQRRHIEHGLYFYTLTMRNANSYEEA